MTLRPSPTAWFQQNSPNAGCEAESGPDVGEPFW
jgi:hypothetical protein